MNVEGRLNVCLLSSLAPSVESLVPPGGRVPHKLIPVACTDIHTYKI